MELTYSMLAKLNCEKLPFARNYNLINPFNFVHFLQIMWLAAELAAKKTRVKQSLIKRARSVAIFSLKLKERRAREAEKQAYNLAEQEKVNISRWNYRRHKKKSHGVVKCMRNEIRMKKHLTLTSLKWRPAEATHSVGKSFVTINFRFFRVNIGAESSTRWRGIGFDWDRATDPNRRHTPQKLSLVRADKTYHNYLNAVRNNTPYNTYEYDINQYTSRDRTSTIAITILLTVNVCTTQIIRHRKWTRTQDKEFNWLHLKAIDSVA